LNWKWNTRGEYSAKSVYEIQFAALFWEDRWLHGQRIIDVAPRLHSLVAKKTIKKRTVAEALTEHLSISDVRGASSIGELVILIFGIFSRASLCNMK